MAVTPAGREAEMVRREALLAAAGDSERLAALLDPLAMEAAGGSREALELVVWAVDELRLAEPTVRGLVINRADVEDVTQNVLIAVAETIGGFRGEARFRTWLNQVARFKAIDHLRRKRDEASLDEIDVTDAARISSMLADRATLARVLDGLPEHYGRAIVLRDVQQLAYEDIARQLNVAVNTARSRVARGRALVAARLAEG
jgi:RNA polymerase sigma-70 factor (ECF subfamily)